LGAWRGAPLRFELPVGAGQISLADMDSDGLMDLVFLSPHPQAEAGGRRGAEGAEGAGAAGGGVLHVWYGALWRGNVSQAEAEAMAAALAAPASKACRKAAASPPETLCSSAEHARLAFVQRNWSLPAGWLPLTAAAAAAAAASSSFISAASASASASAALLQRPPTL